MKRSIFSLSRLAIWRRAIFRHPERTLNASLPPEIKTSDDIEKILEVLSQVEKLWKTKKVKEIKELELEEQLTRIKTNVEKILERLKRPENLKELEEQDKLAGLHNVYGGADVTMTIKLEGQDNEIPDPFPPPSLPPQRKRKKGREI